MGALIKSDTIRKKHSGKLSGIKFIDTKLVSQHGGTPGVWHAGRYWQ